MRARSDMLLNGQSDVAPVNGEASEFSENIETVREILREYHKDNELQVTEIACCPGSKAGDNYMSLIKRIVATIRTTSNAGEYWETFYFVLWFRVWLTCRYRSQVQTFVK